MTMEAIRLFCCLTLLAAFTTEVKIRCSYENAFWDTGSVYTCRVTEIDVDNPISVSEVCGTHKEGKNNADVRVLLF